MRTTYIEDSLATIAAFSLLEIHQRLFNAKPDSISGIPVITSKKRTVMVLVDQIPFGAGLAKNVISRLNELFNTCLPAPGCFVSLETDYKGKRIKGLYVFTSEGLLGRLHGPIVQLLWKKRNFNKASSVIKLLEAPILGLVVHEARHELQVYENIKLKGLNYLRLFGDKVYQKGKTMWKARSTKIPPQQKDHDKDALVSEVAAEAIWTLPLSPQRKWDRIIKVISS